MVKSREQKLAFKKIEKLTLEEVQEREERWIFECEAGHRVAMQVRRAEKGNCPLCRIGLKRGKNDFPTLYPHIAGDLVKTSIPSFEPKNPANMRPSQARFLRFRCPKCRRIYRSKLKDEVRNHKCPHCGPIPIVTLEPGDIDKALRLLPEAVSNRIVFFDTGVMVMCGAQSEDQDVYLALRGRRSLGPKCAVVLDRQTLYQLSLEGGRVFICGWNGKVYVGDKLYKATICDIPDYPSFFLARSKGYRPPSVKPDTLAFWGTLAGAIRADSIGIAGDKKGNAVVAALVDDRPVAIGRLSPRD